MEVSLFHLSQTLASQDSPASHHRLANQLMHFRGWGFTARWRQITFRKGSFVQRPPSPDRAHFPNTPFRLAPSTGAERCHRGWPAIMAKLWENENVMAEEQGPTTSELLYLHERPRQSFCQPCLRRLAQEDQPTVPAEIKSVKAAALVVGRAYLEGPDICSNCGRRATVLRSD
jgi:hypothetical protein